MKILKRVFLSCTALMSLTALAAAPKTTPSEPRECFYAREYITALGYLRSKADFRVSEKDARAYAYGVAMGCTGAAKRFIRVAQVLSYSGLGSMDSVKLGAEFASRTDTETSTFVFVFLKSFLEDDLDLNIGTAVDLARSLSTEFQGDIDSVRKDFQKLVHFCVSDSELGLPKPLCATTAARVAKGAERFKGELSGPFIQLYRFLTSEKGPGLNQTDALQTSERMIKAGPKAAENFIHAYQYAISQSGLELPVRDAFNFAEKMLAPEGSHPPTPATSKL